jgi:hypothetical protein
LGAEGEGIAEEDMRGGRMRIEEGLTGIHGISNEEVLARIVRIFASLVF